MPCARVVTTLPAKTDNVLYRRSTHNIPPPFLHKITLQAHIKTKHKGNYHRCQYDNCEKRYVQQNTLDRHIQAVQQGRKLPCVFDGCDKIFSYGGKAKHVEKVHLGIRYPCPCADCDKVFTKKTSLPIHIKTVHGTLEQAAEMREKRLQLRSLLAEKEAQGICSTIKTCQNPAIQGSFFCQYQEKIVDSVAQAQKQDRRRYSIIIINPNC